MPAFILLTALLSATGCGESSAPAGDASDQADSVEPDSAPLAGSVERIGFVDLEHNDNNRYVLDARMYQATPPIDGEHLRALLERAPDDCHVETVSSDSGALTALLASPQGDATANWPALAQFAEQLQSIDSGDSLQLSSGGAPLTELLASRTGDRISYALSEEYVTGWPNDVLLSAVDGAFSEWGQIELSGVSAMRLFEPAPTSEITTETEFRWPTAEQSDTRLTFQLHAYDSVSQTVQYVECVVMDDGEFTFPDAVKSELGEQFRTRHLQITRQRLQLHTDDDSILVISQNSRL